MTIYKLVAEYPDDHGGKKRDRYPIPDSLYSPYPHYMDIEAKNHDEVRAFIIRKVGYPKSMGRVWVNVYTGSGKPIGYVAIHTYRGYDKDETYTWTDARGSAVHTVDPRTGKLIGPNHLSEEYQISRLPFAKSKQIVKLTAPEYTGYEKITKIPSIRGSYSKRDKVYVFLAKGPYGALEQIYIGLSSHYKSGYYDNSDDTLIPVGNNKEIWEIFRNDVGGSYLTQAEAHSPAAYREFEKIRKNILSKYTLVKPISYKDGPYRPPRTSTTKKATAKPTTKKAPAKSKATVKKKPVVKRGTTAQTTFGDHLIKKPSKTTRRN